VSHLLEPFYKPRREQELRQQPFAPYEWVKTKAALSQVASLLHSRRSELAGVESRLNLVARKNNHGNVATLMGKKLTLAALVSGQEQMHAEIELRMQVLTSEVERSLQALRLHYEEAEVQIDRLFAHLWTGKEIDVATGQLQTIYAEVEALSHHLLKLGYPFDEASFRACNARISQVLRLPPSRRLQLLAQIEDWLKESASESTEGETLQMYRPSRQVADLLSFHLDSNS
jgi:hypothetical protein